MFPHGKLHNESKRRFDSSVAFRALDGITILATYWDHCVTDSSHAILKRTPS